jgi:hypothetical protein
MREGHRLRTSEKFIGYGISVLLPISSAAAVTRIEATTLPATIHRVADVTQDDPFAAYLDGSFEAVHACKTELCPIDDKGHILKKHAALAFVEAEQLLGGRIELSGSMSAYRTPEQQDLLFRCHQDTPKVCAGAFPANHPRANHQKGEAIDAKDWRNPEVVNALLTTGWVRPYGNEPWHFENRLVEHPKTK